MPSTGDRRDYDLATHFHVEIEGIDGAAFNKVSGLKTETEVFELQEGGENSLVRKLIGQSRASNIVLTSGFVNAASLYEWRDQLVNSGEQVRKSGSIIQYDSKMNEVARWRFFNAIPIRWEMGDFDAMGNAAQCEVLELAVESIKKGT
jgi:phage tail-like protein